MRARLWPHSTSYDGSPVASYSPSTRTRSYAPLCSHVKTVTTSSIWQTIRDDETVLVDQVGVDRDEWVLLLVGWPEGPTHSRRKTVRYLGTLFT